MEKEEAIRLTADGIGFDNTDKIIAEEVWQRYSVSVAMNEVAEVLGSYEDRKAIVSGEEWISNQVWDCIEFANDPEVVRKIFNHELNNWYRISAKVDAEEQLLYQ